MPQFYYLDKTEVKPDYSQTAHYLGYKKIVTPQEEISKLIENAAEKMQQIIQPRGTFEIFPLEVNKNHIKFADLNFYSNDLGRNLNGCSQIAIFAATIGPQVDAMIRKAEISSPVEAAILQATGAMFIEEFVEMLNKKIRQDVESAGFSTRPRYSPGYGDVSIEMQKDFFRLLPCSRIGLTLMNTLIMAPEKSVTAFIGIY